MNASLDDIKKAYENRNFTILFLNDHLIRACLHGDILSVRYLSCLEEVNISLYDNAPINMASANGHLEVVEFLAGNPNIEYDIAFITAIVNGHFNIIKKLADLPNVDRKAGIRMALAHEHREIVEYLLKI